MRHVLWRVVFALVSGMISSIHRPRGLAAKLPILTLMFSLISSGSRAAIPSYDFTETTRLMDSNLVHYGAAGVLAIVEQQGRVILRYSNSEGSPLIRVREDSAIAVASCSKWFSGAIVLALVERGFFGLDDSIARYLPAFDVPIKRGITIRQCFAMTSGLSLRDPDYELDRSLTLAQSVDLIASNTPIVFPPGTMLDYEGDAMQVVGRIAEVTTGRDWRDLAREFLFQPLGMSSAAYDVFGLNPAIAGGARCSAQDYLKFLRMILYNGVAADGRIVLNSRTVQTFFTNQTAGLPERFSPWPESPYNPYGARGDYGMGSWIMAVNPDSGAVEEVASPGAFGSFPWVDRRRGLCGVFFTLTLSKLNDTNPTHLQVLAAIRREVDRVGLPTTTPQSDPDLVRSPDGFTLRWGGNGTLEESVDLMNWSPIPWATSPFTERWQKVSASDPTRCFRVSWRSVGP